MSQLSLPDPAHGGSDKPHTVMFALLHPRLPPSVVRGLGAEAQRQQVLERREWNIVQRPCRRACGLFPPSLNCKIQLIQPHLMSASDKTLA
jgi:hypothetical protein